MTGISIHAHARVATVIISSCFFASGTISIRISVQDVILTLISCTKAGLFQSTPIYILLDAWFPNQSLTQFRVRFVSYLGNFEP